MLPHLLEKYNIPAPRYTSYPTVPYWERTPTAREWIDSVRQAFARDREISLYIHLPYCESLCTYCGCNKRITKNHGVEAPYVDALLREWEMYRQQLPAKPILRELHLGGGTPTFFQPEQLERLLRGILEEVDLPDAHHFSVEAHPGTTTRPQLEGLADLGFNRLSIGIQDFAPEILEIINRQQREEEVEQCTAWARELGYTSINYDLIFGLPLQTPEHVRTTMRKIARLLPDRIAFYSYAHVPWIKPSQRAYSEADLPVGKEKRELYELGRSLLEQLTYREIGLDHFALPGDALARAARTGELHRNFMGYTPFKTELGLALGASSIADSGTCFIQNEKDIEPYLARVAAGEFPILRGHLLSPEDRIVRRHILNLMCRHETQWKDRAEQPPMLAENLKRLAEPERDGLVEVHRNGIRVTEHGMPFLRNIALAFDTRFWTRQPDGQLFSQVV